MVKAFGALTVTDGVSFSVEPGEIHALIGPNGAGKTTLIRQIAGELAPDAGSLYLAGTEVTRWREPERSRFGLARTFQVSSLLTASTVLDNLILAAQTASPQRWRLMPAPAEDRRLADRALDAMHTVGLTSRAGTLAGELAHGEQRALELAMVLIQEPKLLLLDEPMAGTGADETAMLAQILKSLRGSVAMLLVEHDMQAVFALADRISVLVGGRIVATGNPDAIRTDAGVRAAYLGTQAG